MGSLGGMLGGLVGVGGGVLFVPALVIFLDQAQVQAEATSLLAIVFVAALGAWRQYGYGNVRVRDGLVMGAMGVLGVAGGVAIANTVSESHARADVCRALPRDRRSAGAPGAEGEPSPPLQTVLQGPLDRGVECVQPVEGQGLRRVEAWRARPAAPSGP